MGKVQITTKGISKFLKSYTEEKSISEYVWNGFDAEASIIDIITTSNNVGKIEKVEIIDNGSGIEFEKLSSKFVPFYQSEKNADNNVKISKVHGRNGLGRLTFFCFANNAKWETVYNKGKENIKYEIYIDGNELESYTTKNKETTEEKTGTKVTLYNINKIIDIETLKKYLILEFGWYLKLYTKKILNLNGEKIYYEDNVIDKECFELEDEETKKKFDIEYIQWNEKINEEYSRYYFINSVGEERFKETTTLNKKGDSFYHSIYIKSEIFDNFYISKDNIDGQTTLDGYSKSSKEFKFIKKEIDKYLKSKRKPYLAIVAQNLIENYKKEEIFPEYNEKNLIEKYKHQELENLVSIVCEKEPKIFSQLNKEQKKTLVRLFDLIIENGDTNSLFKILDQVIDLDDDERDELAELLDKSSMSNITKTIKLIQDRYKAVAELKELVFNPDLKANEVDHLQTMIENHYWLFGEEYSLVTAEEPNFEEALRRYLYILEDDEKKVEMEAKNKRKQMDIFAVRRNVNNGKIENIVVELKHTTNVKLGKKQLDQVIEYMDTILKEKRFNNYDEQWNFYLIGTEFDTSGYIERAMKNVKEKNEKSLVWEVDNYKIYVKKWSEIFSDFEIKHNFLQEKLQLQKEKLLEKGKYDKADNIIEEINSNSATKGYSEKLTSII